MGIGALQGHEKLFYKQIHSLLVQRPFVAWPALKLIPHTMTGLLIS